MCRMVARLTIAMTSVAAAAVESEGKQLTSHGIQIVSAICGSRTLETLKEETADAAGSLIQDASEGGPTLQKIRRNVEVAWRASEHVGKAVRAVEEIPAKHPQELRELVERRSGH